MQTCLMWTEGVSGQHGELAFLWSSLKSNQIFRLHPCKLKTLQMAFFPPCFSVFMHTLESLKTHTEQGRRQFASMCHRLSLQGRDPIESISNPNQRVIQHHLLFPLFSALLNVAATTSACQYGAHEPPCVGVSCVWQQVVISRPFC